MRRCGEGIIKLVVFVIFNFLKRRALSRRKKELKMSLLCSQGESTIKDIDYASFYGCTYLIGRSQATIASAL